MRSETLEKAIAEAVRFIEAAKKVEIIHVKCKNGVTLNQVRGGRQAAACKRISMDLSIALAELRK